MTTTFRYAGHAVRVFAGRGVIESQLAAEVARWEARRVFVLTSRSVADGAVPERLRAALGERFAEMFGGIEKDSTFSSVQAATVAAREAGADLLVAVGGGSVIVAARAVAIFLAEAGDPFDLMTQYAAGRPPHSPRLEAAKLPIVNIPLTPTAAADRAGTGLKNPDLDHRMEFFDPKTRPRAVLFDVDALLRTPPAVVRSTATTLYAATLAGVATSGRHPLAEGDRRQAFRLTQRAYAGLPASIAADRLDEVGVLDLCAAAFLQNRAEDGDRTVVRSGAFAGDYAVSTALHLLHPEVGQGEATSVLASTVMRLAPDPDPAQARRVAEALGVDPSSSARDLACASAEVVEAAFSRAGMPTRVRDLGIPRESLPHVAAQTVRNFNANRGASDAEETVRSSLRLLEAAW